MDRVVALTQSALLLGLPGVGHFVIFDGNFSPCHPYERSWKSCWCVDHLLGLDGNRGELRSLVLPGFTD